MERDQIRLECIKLAAQRTGDHKDSLKRAAEYFDFVMEIEVDEKVAEKSVKHTGNAKSPN